MRGIELNWIVSKRGKLTPFIIQWVENRNEISEMLQATKFSEGLPPEIEPQPESQQILEQRSPQFGP
jgi:hypothetical protein